MELDTIMGKTPKLSGGNTNTKFVIYEDNAGTLVPAKSLPHQFTYKSSN